MAEALIAIVIALILLPPAWDPAILIKEFQMGYRPKPDEKFWRGVRNAFLPCLALWAVFAFIIWLIIR